eukprot:gnl/TRDRNA2_/TRDRNA2_189753_c0_seq1.p1 gnl/TRDRNA2_/TRDRNA2_189753_c0~~gnl/TRDRNA2_/TRDRNA2_189753_c0_seq1.p1  ORF type:complete len:320 (+),score=75.48 gnl/TRDRNA2_/TRDRNA2_189753_c0_seq1:96-962(+)
MEPGEYDGLVARASTGNPSNAIELLQFMRTHKIIQPELTLLHGGKLLSTCPRKLGDEKWTVMEQVFIAAISLGSEDWRDYCLKALMKKFPNSGRVERLKGLYHESVEDYAEANKIYTKILADKPEDTVARKRLIAVYKQRGKIAEAIDQINIYLDTFCTDAEVWHELAELYIEAGSLSRAAFCFEELILANPHSMYHVLTYAELLFSTGDFELSRKYFSLASYLDGSCLRALWGLVMVNMSLAEKDKNNPNMAQLQTFAIDRLRAQYKSASGTHCKAALALIDGVFAA